MRGISPKKLWRSGAVAALVLTLAGCAGLLGQGAPLSKPVARPAPDSVQKPHVAQPTSIKSAMLRQYLAQVYQAQSSQGLLRQDGGGADTPYTADMLARNFEQIAFFNEYDSDFTGRGGASPLRRWAGPVRMTLVFGEGIAASQRQSVSNDVTRYARRLARATGHPIATADAPNFLVIVASEDDRDAALSQAAARIPGISDTSLAALRNMRKDTYCAVAAYATGPDPNTYTAAVAVIRAENPDLLLLSCIHEELAQGLGLANDSPTARPSIFNDDDEFALLTTHDELLLKMLYDPRLHPGMSAREAEPITRIIARELTGAAL
jgi:hypothetical protein